MRSSRISLARVAALGYEATVGTKRRPTLAKRQKEQARRDRQTLKAERRTARAANQRNRPELLPGEDPDIAGIVPGPQTPSEDDKSGVP